MNPPINFLPWRQQRRTAFLRFWLLMFVAPLLLAVGITLILRLTGSAEARIDAVLLQAEQQLARSLQITKPRLLRRLTNRNGLPGISSYANSVRDGSASDNLPATGNLRWKHWRRFYPSTPG